MLLVKMVTAFAMFLGLIGTFLHILPGLPLIFFAALGYSLAGGFLQLEIYWLIVLAVLMLTGELGSRYIVKLMPDTGIEKVHGLDVAAGSFASLVVTDVLLGPTLGLIAWEVLLGKSLMPVIKRSGLLVLELFAAAMMRFTIAMAMIIIIVFRVL